jgi:hypothetical protein
MTDFPVISDTDWYTMYPSKGYYQEGEAAARYLNGIAESLRGKPVVQIVRDSREGRALAAGFLETWRELGQQAPASVTLKRDEVLTGDFLNRLATKESPAVLILWDGAEALPSLEALAGIAKKPEMLLVSGRYLGKSLVKLPEQIRDFTYLTFPYTFSQVAVNPSPMGATKVPDDLQMTLRPTDMMVQDATKKTKDLTNTLTQLLTMALMDMRGNYYRDNFLDVIGMIADQPSAVFGRLSFGPGQRYAAKGCYIVQLGKGQDPELVKKSTWVIH